MAITLDTAIVFAYYDRSDSWIAETDRQYAAFDLGFVDVSIIARRILRPHTNRHNGPT